MNLYESILGPDWQLLDPHVRLSHTPPLSAVGTIKIESKAGLIGRMVASMMGLPPPSESILASLTLRENGDVVVWNRRFGDVSMVTRQSKAGDLLREQSDAGDYLFALSAVDGSLVYRSRSCVPKGRFLPRWLLPQVRAKVSGAEKGWIVRVDVRLPLLGTVYTYGGPMRIA